jgi:rhamnosyltransferase
VHFAVSSHCRLRHDDWVERSLAHYADTRVAGTNGGDRTPDLAPLETVYLQTAGDVLREPFWGFSNHASSWRAAVWRRLTFSERLPTAEDKEWALRVLRAGWLLAYHPDLLVDQSHQWRRGARVFYRRSLEETRALESYVELPPYGVRDLVREWWLPRDPRASLLRLGLSPRRIAGLAGAWVGRRPSRQER